MSSEKDLCPTDEWSPGSVNEIQQGTTDNLVNALTKMGPAQDSLETKNSELTRKFGDSQTRQKGSSTKNITQNKKVAEKFLNHEIGITQVSVRLDKITISGATKIINKKRIDKNFQEIETYNGNLHSKPLPSNSTRTGIKSI